MSSEDELIAARRRHAEALTEAGTRPYPNDFDLDASRRRALFEIGADEARLAALPNEQAVSPDDETYALYGRVVAKRGPFLVIQTPHGQAQALVRAKELPADDAAQLKVVDLADHVLVTGPAMRTGTGALALKATRYRHVGKALLPPPDKWHGLSDIEIRYRERYVDLFANPAVAEVFRARAAIISTLRRTLERRDFVEVETPILHALVSGAAAKPFATHHNALDIPLFLRVAPELHLKRLLVGGFDRVFELGRAFRNEGVSTRHNPEFSILEAYEAYAERDRCARLVEALIRAADATVREQFPALAEARAFEVDAEWPRVPMRDAVLAALGRGPELGVPPSAWRDVLDEKVLDDADALDDAFAKTLPNLSKDARAPYEQAMTFGDRIQTLFEHVAEPMLPKLYRTKDGARSLPVFVTEHPREASPLARANDDDPRFCDRFELFVEASETANGFSELNDPDEQAARMRDQLARRERGDEEAMDLDEDYIRALMHGMPPAAGLGIGIDRLVMALCGQPSIRDVLLFPLMRPGAR